MSFNKTLENLSIMFIAERKSIVLKKMLTLLT
uniref:Uncharacterized protein n=1 Tax=Siphoviridae sp. cteNz1 TaxID=2826404 RepID=A0A8S5N6T0_9CAUD|nr:MAG TPA: hypothetical protein [Siphoviridae sp. cteNz1]